MGDGSLVLVTGAGGYIGSWVVRRLCESGYRVRGTTRSADPSTCQNTLHLRQSMPAHQLQLVSVDLERDAGWDDAVAGCRHVLHVASPFQMRGKYAEDFEGAFRGPAVKGTRRVLEACARARSAGPWPESVVVTSSVAAVSGGHDVRAAMREGRVFSEADWSIEDGCAPYTRSKLLAEQEAWRVWRSMDPAQRFRLACVNPGYVHGPPLSARSARDATSMAVVASLIRPGSVPMVPRIGFPVVDVRDVADAHVACVSNPDASGRFLCVARAVWMAEMADWLAADPSQWGGTTKVTTRRAPYLLLLLASFFLAEAKVAMSMWGEENAYDTSRAQNVLGITFRHPRESILDQAKAMVQLAHPARDQP